MNIHLINILPGARMLLGCLRFALVIVALLLLACSVVQLAFCQLRWVKVYSGISVFFDFSYLVLMLHLTSYKHFSENKSVYYILYGILILSSVATLIMLLCGGDYSLYEILGGYIFMESERLILPIATIIFVSITYWLPINSIRNILNKYNYYCRVKENIKYDK